MARKKKIELEQVFVKPVSASLPTYPDLVESASTETVPMDAAPIKKGRGRPKGSKNKSAPVVENIIAEEVAPAAAEPNTVLVASIAEDVMRKIIERREKSREMTKEAKESLREGKEIEEKRKMWEAGGPRMKKENPPIPEELKEKSEESLNVTKDVRESTEALVKDKAQAFEARDLLRQKKFFAEREELAKKRREAAISEAEKAKESLAKPEKPVATVEGFTKEKSAYDREVAEKRTKELEVIRKKYAQYENQFSRGEKEKVLTRGTREHEIEAPKEKKWWEKAKNWWERVMNEGRK